MTEYSTARVRGAFITGHPEWERDLQGDDLIAADFDRWLRKVQAEAWEEGYLDMDKDRIYGTGTENPYREDLQST